MTGCEGAFQFLTKALGADFDNARSRICRRALSCSATRQSARAVRAQPATCWLARARGGGAGREEWGVGAWGRLRPQRARAVKDRCLRGRRRPRKRPLLRCVVIRLTLLSIIPRVSIAKKHLDRQREVTATGCREAAQGKPARWSKISVTRRILGEVIPKRGRALHLIERVSSCRWRYRLKKDASAGACSTVC